MKSKIRKLLSMLLLSVAVLQPVEAVQAGTMYKVNGANSYLALRSEKSYVDDNEIGKMYNGDNVWVEEKEDGDYWWVYSSRNGKYGYANKNFLKRKKVSNIKKVKVATGYLALRSAKAYDEANEIGELYTGDVVIVKNKKDPVYWRVYSPKYETYGYVNKNYLKSKVSFQTKYVNVASDYLALRSSKQYSHNNEIDKLYNGDAVEVIEKFSFGYWYVYSPEKNKYGFVSEKYLGDKDSDDIWKVKVDSGYLALRSGPSYNGLNETGRLFTGDTVTVVLKDGTYWYVYSSRLDKYGYVNKNYLVQPE